MKPAGRRGMSKRTFRIREGEPLLDVVSYGRGGPGETRGRLTPAELEQIRRTVQRTPEVVVKVLPRASNDLKAVGKHLDYIGRKGDLELETDDGERLSGRIGKELLDDWDLDIDDMRRQASPMATMGRKRPKLVHKLMFSMPPGTSPEKETKERFAAVARHQGLSDSALLKRLVELMLQTAGAAELVIIEPVGRPARDSRVTVRLRIGDQLLLRERAAARGMPSATYLAVLARAHLRSLVPLPKAELTALKRTVSELGDLGRNLNQIAHAANEGERVPGPGRDDVKAMLRVCEALRDHVKGLIRANLNSWEQGHAERNG
jgi:hypothetical protein